MADAGADGADAFEDATSDGQGDVRDGGDLSVLPSEGQVWSPDAILSAAESGVISKDLAGAWLWALFMGRADLVPVEYRLSAAEVAASPHFEMARLTFPGVELEIDAQAVMDAVFGRAEGEQKDGHELVLPSVSPRRYCQHSGGGESGQVAVWVEVVEGAEENSPAEGSFPPLELPSCDELPDSALVGSVRPHLEAIRTALEQAYDSFESQMSWERDDPKMIVVLFSTAAGWDSTFGTVGTVDGACWIFVKAVPHDTFGTTVLETLRATVVHEALHCAQYYEGLGLGDDVTTWALESTAAWVEDYLYPGANTEHRYLERYISRAPGADITDLLYGGIFPFWHMARVQGIDPGWVFSWLSDTTQASLVADLITTVDADLSAGGAGSRLSWHEANVATLNRAPAVPLLDNDGWAIEPQSFEPFPPSVDRDEQIDVLDVANSAIWAGSGIAPLSFSVPMWTLNEEVTRVRFTLPTDAGLEVSLFWEVDENNNWVELATGENEFVLCRERRGPCHDVPEEEIIDAQVVGLVLTNFSAEDTITELGSVDTWTTALHGTWISTSLTGSGTSVDPPMTIPIWSQQGEIVAIDEGQLPVAIEEDFASATTSQGCTPQGSFSAQIEIEYGPLDDQGNATGTVQFSVAGSSTTGTVGCAGAGTPDEPDGGLISFVQIASTDYFAQPASFVLTRGSEGTDDQLVLSNRGIYLGGPNSAEYEMTFRRASE